MYSVYLPTQLPNKICPKISERCGALPGGGGVAYSILSMYFTRVESLQELNLEPTTRLVVDTKLKENVHEFHLRCTAS